MEWKDLNSIEQLDELVKKSFKKPVVIFKHSTRCGISRSVFSRFKSKSLNYFNEFDFYYLNLLEFRAISNEISLKFNVAHKSPQVLVIKNGEALAHHSHYEILSSLILDDFI